MKYTRLLLINTPGIEQDGYRSSPLGILYLAAYIRKYCPKIKVDICDEAFNDLAAVKVKITTFQPDLVGFSCLTPGRINAIKTAMVIKKVMPKVKIVFGGVHPTIMWEQMMKCYPVVDFIVRGEGEITLRELVEGKKLSKIKGLVWRREQEIINNPDQPLIRNLDSLPLPAWDLINPLGCSPVGDGVYNGINISKTARVPLIFSRGCMGACTFCSSWKIWQGYRSRTGKNVCNEVELLYEKYKVRHFAFQDDTLTGNQKEITIFCREILKRKIKAAFYGTTRADQVNLTLLRLMKKAGFYEISYGVETGSEEMLKKINKKTDLDTTQKAIALTKKAGIRACALMMYGLPGESEKDRQVTEKLLNESKPDYVATLGEVWIFPGTALYQQAKKAKLISDKFWLGIRPAYVYRGGLYGDKINHWRLFKDWYYDYFKQTWLGKSILQPVLQIRRRLFFVTREPKTVSMFKAN